MGLSITTGAGGSGFATDTVVAITGFGASGTGGVGFTAGVGISFLIDAGGVDGDGTGGVLATTGATLGGSAEIQCITESRNFFCSAAGIVEATGFGVIAHDEKKDATNSGEVVMVQMAWFQLLSWRLPTVANFRSPPPPL